MAEYYVKKKLEKVLAAKIIASNFATNFCD